MELSGGRKIVIGVILAIGVTWMTSYLIRINQSFWKGIVGTLIIVILAIFAILTSIASARNRECIPTQYPKFKKL